MIRIVTEKRWKFFKRYDGYLLVRYSVNGLPVEHFVIHTKHEPATLDKLNKLYHFHIYENNVKIPNPEARLLTEGDPKQFFRSDGVFIYSMYSPNFPVSTPKRITGLAGVTRRAFNLEKAEKMLQKNEWVYDIKRIVDNAGEVISLEYTVHLPQHIHNKLVKKFRDIEKSEFWVTRLNGCFGACCSYRVDVLNLAPALL